MGSIFGGALFVTTITVGLVIEKAGGQLHFFNLYLKSIKIVKTNPIMTQRDSFFYFISITIIIVYGIIGYIKWWMALLFILVYFLYLAYVLYLEKT